MKEPTAAPSPVRFGPFEADVSSGELRKHGLRIKLPDQSFQVLAMLLERPGQVVTREELHKKLWPADTFVDFDHGLNNAINRLREALGDSADNPRFIETLPKRGYRFIASVEHPPVTTADSLDNKSSTPSPGESASSVIHPPAESPSAFAPRRAVRSWRRLEIFALGLAASLGLVTGVSTIRQRLAGRPAQAAIRSIAVLPLENLSGDPAQEYFTDGMTDALITDLAQIGSLKVISRTSVMRYKGTHKPLPEIAKELNVDGIVEGVVIQSGGRVRVDAQLIDATTDRHFWARSYERSLGDVIALQNEVARAVANEIQGKLTPQEQARLARAETVDPQAYEFYVKGRYFWSKRSEAFVQKSINYFQQAIQRQPHYALAYAAMAEAYSASSVLPPVQRCSKAKAAARTALQMDETMAEAHTALAACLFWYDWDWAGSEKEFQRALELNPNYAQAHQWYGLTQRAMGREQIWAAEVTRSHELDPLYLGGVGPTGLLTARGKQDLVIERLREKLELEPDAYTYVSLGNIYAQKGMYREAIAYLQKGVSLSDGDPYFLSVLGYTYGVSGERDRALKIVRQLTLLSKRRYVSPYQIARVYIGLGEKDRAFDWLQKAVADRSIPLPPIQSPVFDGKSVERMNAMRSDPRYAELIRRIGLPQ